MGLKALPLNVLALLMLQGCSSHPLADQCYEKPASGRCEASHRRFYYDPDRGDCRAFIWGGCNGNVPFETLEDCTRTCGTGPGQGQQSRQSTGKTPADG